MNGRIFYCSLVFFFGLLNQSFNKTDHTVFTGAEKNKKLMIQYYDEIMTRHNIAGLGKFINEEYLDHTPEADQKQGREGLKAELLSVFNAFPNLEIKVQNALADNSLVAIRYKV